MDHRESYHEFIKKLFDLGELFKKPERLEGVGVLEVCALVLGPSACDYLAEFGAEVIKFEVQKNSSLSL